MNWTVLNDGRLAGRTKSARKAKRRNLRLMKRSFIDGHQDSAMYEE
jgi:hypothetical protein